MTCGTCVGVLWRKLRDCGSSRRPIGGSIVEGSPEERVHGAVYVGTYTYVHVGSDRPELAL